MRAFIFWCLIIVGATRIQSGNIEAGVFFLIAAFWYLLVQIRKEIDEGRKP